MHPIKKKRIILSLKGSSLSLKLINIFEIKNKRIDIDTADGNKNKPRQNKIKLVSFLLKTSFMN